MCSCFGRLYFGVATMLWTVPCWLVIRIMLCFAACCPGYLPKVHVYSKIIYSWANWMILRTLCCFLGIRIEGVREMNAALDARAEKPRLLIMNHQSLFDVMVLASVLSPRSGGDLKALMSSHVAEIPITGGIVTGCGHFAIPFKSQETKAAENAAEGSIADFSVDKDAVQRVMGQFEEWVRTGHIGFWFPEGRLNPNPLKLQTFRAGGFKVAVDIDAEIWCVCAGGFEVFWHRKAPIGGVPANCRVKAFKLCDSSSALLKELAEGDDTIDDKQKQLLIANHAQDKMQEVRDEITADPWVSKSPQSEDHSGLDSPQSHGIALVGQESP